MFYFSLTLVLTLLRIEPILDRIHQKSTAALCPLINSIKAEDLHYNEASYPAVGGFTWSGSFTWWARPEYAEIVLSDPYPYVHEQNICIFHL